MKSYVIDTSSLLSFIKYYQPFDTNNQLTKYLQDCFRDGTLILLEAVQNECKRVSGGIIFDNLSRDLKMGRYLKRYRLFVKMKKFCVSLYRNYRKIWILVFRLII